MDRVLMKMLDEQLRPYATRITEEIGIADNKALYLATSISGEINGVDDELFLRQVRDSSPLSVKHRLFFFEDFLIWNKAIEPTLGCPSSTPYPPERVQNAFNEMLVLIQLYVSFVFVGDGLFEVLARRGPQGSCVRKCARYIRNNPLRALRNAIAHGNWHLVHPDSLRYWARKGSDAKEPVTEFNVTADDMNFYLVLTRYVAWSSLLSISERQGDDDDGLWYV